MYEGVCKKGVESFAIFVGAYSTVILFPYAFHTWSEFKLESKMPLQTILSVAAIYGMWRRAWAGVGWAGGDPGFDLC